MLYVYFIQAGTGGPVKIGIAADPEARLESMQIGNHAELVLLAAIPGTLTLERELHQRFAAGRVRGEWFDYETPGLREEIVRAVSLETNYWLANERVCPQCGLNPVLPPRTKVCSDACYQARKRSITQAWKAARR